MCLHLNLRTGTGCCCGSWRFAWIFPGTWHDDAKCHSQIIEQIVNAIISVWAAYVLYRYGTRIGAVLGDAEHYGPAYGAAGGTLGTNLGSVAALIFVLFVFLLICMSLSEE